MPVPRIPTSLKVVVSGYSFEEQGGVKRTPVAGGYSRYGLQYNRGTRPFRASMILTQGQLAIWEIFYNHKIQKGAVTFEMDLDSGLGVAAHNVNIIPGSYSASPISGKVLWSVAFALEAEPTVYEYTQEDADQVLLLWEQVGPELGALLDRIERFANVDARILDA